MQILKCIIHHADAVQKQYLVQKVLPSIAPKTANSSTFSIDNMSSILIRTDTATAEINDKCYQRWHQVLQEGLVPISVRALNLLDKSGEDAMDDEEETYFATMEGMDEEIQVMAILARAAALNDISADEDAKKDTAENNEDGMKEINAMMKCAAMLLFHVVLGSSGEMNEEATTKNDVVSSEETGTVVGYDGRVRHVMKLACVDILSRAILEAVESFDNNNVSIEKDKREQRSAPYDMDEYSFWNIANIKTILDQTDLGKDAIFITGQINNVGMEMLLEADDENKSEKQEKGRSQ